MTRRVGAGCCARRGLVELLGGSVLCCRERRTEGGAAGAWTRWRKKRDWWLDLS
uniref:Uncharacterized protein n=1 Tax=Arundo donax TaxID=35708 RepID=A0A0A9DKD5_ARUDO